MANQKILGSKAELKDPNHNLSLDKSIHLGIQHVLAMFARMLLLQLLLLISQVLHLEVLIWFTWFKWQCCLQV